MFRAEAVSLWVNIHMVACAKLYIYISLLLAMDSQGQILGHDVIRLNGSHTCLFQIVGK